MSSLPFPELLSRFASGPRLYLHRANDVEAPSGGRGRRYWVISRTLCRFYRVPLLADASAGRRLEALKLEIDRLSPFAETGSHFHFGADAVSLWLWDARAAHDAADALDVDFRRLIALPEAALQPPGDGVRLVECLDGVEGQCWEGGTLLASRWWRGPPDARSWVLFQRSASVRPGQMAAEPPASIALPWLARPWTRAPSGGWGGVSGLDLRFAAAGLGCAFVAGYGYIGAEWLRLRLDTSHVEAEVDAVSAEIEPIVRARTTALADQAAIERLHALNPYPSQLALMAKVATILPKNETHFSEWSYDSGQLQITVTAAHPLDATYFVRSLERVDHFKEVSAERAGGDNTLRIRLKVEPQ